MQERCISSSSGSYDASAVAVVATIKEFNSLCYHNH